MQTGISLCMIVKNEEESLDRCLRSVEGVVDEIVLVDTGSTDSTMEIGRRHGANVLNHLWQNDFAEARNAALAEAKHEWILVLDADEELEASSRAKIRQLLSSVKEEGVEITVRSEMPETDILKFDDTKIVRLFRNRENYRYTLPIHEQIRPSIERNGGTIIQSDLLITHHGYSSAVVQGGNRRTERNLRMLQETVSKSPDNPYLHYQIGATLMSMGRKQEAYEAMKKVLTLDYVGMGPAVVDHFFMKTSQLALDRNENEAAVMYAYKSLEVNPSNGIAMYVAAVGLLSMNKITDGYQMLLRIRQNGENNLRLDIQLDHLIKACQEVLKV